MTIPSQICDKGSYQRVLCRRSTRSWRRSGITRGIKERQDHLRGSVEASRGGLSRVSSPFDSGRCPAAQRATTRRCRLKPRPHRQLCRCNIVGCYKSKDSFDKVESTLLPFLATMSNEILSFRQSRNKLNMFSLFRLWRKDEMSFDIVAAFGNKSNVVSTLSQVRRRLNTTDVERDDASHSALSDSSRRRLAVSAMTAPRRSGERQL